MARAIDARALENKIIEWLGQPGNGDYCSGYDAALCAVQDLIADMPTITPPNKPLTIEQLREMDRWPVYVVPENEFSEFKGWCVVFVEEGEDDYSGAYPPGTDGWCWSFESYTDQWIAYAYPPAHIDREEWTAEWIYDVEKDTHRCSNCHHTICASNYFGNKLPPYCEMCGKAMTPEAWDELEKRLRG